MRSTLVLCDWAEAVAGKLYMQGGGWNKVLADTPASFAIAVLIRVEYNETNLKKHAVLALVDEDGAAFPAEDPIQVEFDFEVGRPPGMKPGQDQTLTFAAKIVNISF